MTTDKIRHPPLPKERSLEVFEKLMFNPEKPYWRGRLCTVDLLVLTNLDRLLVMLKILFAFFTKQATLMRRSVVLSLPPLITIPVVAIRKNFL